VLIGNRYFVIRIRDKRLKNRKNRKHLAAKVIVVAVF
jgi:hypothetical protein